MIEHVSDTRRPQANAPAWSLASQALADELRDTEHVILRLKARQDAIRAELHSRGTLAEFGYGDAVALERDLLRVSLGEARRRSTRAQALHPARDGSSVIPALAPHTAAAAAEGAIGTEHVDEIVQTLAAVPGSVPASEREQYEKTLVDLARTTGPTQVRKACAHLLERLAQDEKPKDSDEKELAKPLRELHIVRRRDGRYGLSGELDAETGSLLRTVLSPLAKPRPAEDGQRDPRPAAERNGDALAVVLEFVQRSGDLPVEGGERPTVIVTVDYESLRGSVEARDLVSDTTLTAGQLRRIACDAEVLPALLGSDSEVLDLGRSQRLVNRAQRRALILRDKGCIRCGRPPKWCQAHHVWHWIDGGPTDLGNLCLLCSECHRLVHHSGWEIVFVGDTPHSIPPKWIESEQRPWNAPRACSAMRRDSGRRYPEMGRRHRTSPLPSGQ